MGKRNQGSGARQRPRVVLVCGPTASGKSALAVAVARQVGGEVVNADSAQVYRDLHILSARPAAGDMDGVPHHLFGHVGAADVYNAARWAEDARGVIADIVAREKVPVLAGGTGLYIRSLIDGIAPVPAIDPAVRQSVRALEPRDAHARLAALDPAGAARLAPADRTRVARALEVVQSTGCPLAQWQARTEGGIGDDIALDATVLLPPREELMARCDARFAAMMTAGALDEVRRLLALAPPADAPILRAIGVAPLAAHLDGTLGLDEAVAAAVLATRQYAKRQYTWFRNQSPMAWRRETAMLDAAHSAALANAIAGRVTRDEDR